MELVTFHLDPCQEPVGRKQALAQTVLRLDCLVQLQDPCQGGQSPFRQPHPMWTGATAASVPHELTAVAAKRNA